MNKFLKYLSFFAIVALAFVATDVFAQDAAAGGGAAAVAATTAAAALRR